MCMCPRRPHAQDLDGLKDFAKKQLGLDIQVWETPCNLPVERAYLLGPAP